MDPESYKEALDWLPPTRALAWPSDIDVEGSQLGQEERAILLRCRRERGAKIVKFALTSAQAVRENAVRKKAYVFLLVDSCKVPSSQPEAAKLLAQRGRLVKQTDILRAVGKTSAQFSRNFEVLQLDSCMPSEEGLQQLGEAAPSDSLPHACARSMAFRPLHECPDLLGMLEAAYLQHPRQLPPATPAPDNELEHAYQQLQPPRTLEARAREDHPQDAAGRKRARVAFAAAAGLPTPAREDTGAEAAAPNTAAGGGAPSAEGAEGPTSGGGAPSAPDPVLGGRAGTAATVSGGGDVAVPVVGGGVAVLAGIEARPIQVSLQQRLEEAEAEAELQGARAAAATAKADAVRHEARAAALQQQLAALQAEVEQRVAAALQQQLDALQPEVEQQVAAAWGEAEANLLVRLGQEEAKVAVLSARLIEQGQDVEAILQAAGAAAAAEGV